MVMPDHVRLLFTALRDANGWTFALPEILRAMKGTSARDINKASGRTGPVWQNESFDHVLRGSQSLRETIDYIRRNPARRNLAEKPEDYPWLWIKCGAGTPAQSNLTGRKSVYIGILQETRGLKAPCPRASHTPRAGTGRSARATQFTTSP
jgi:hypothetical protein